MKNSSFYRTLVDSPQWKLWLRYNDIDPQWDVHESMECDWLSPRHFQAFIEFCRDAKIVELCNSQSGKQ